MNIAMRPLSYLAERPADETPAFSAARDPIRSGRFSRPPALPAHLAALRDRLRPARSPGGSLPFNDPRVDGLPARRWPAIGPVARDRRGWTGRGNRRPAHGLHRRLAGSHCPGQASVLDRTIAAICTHPACCPTASIPTGWSWCARLKDIETLAAMEVALREGVAAAVVGEVGQLDRTASRRLQLACLRHGSTGFALRRWPHGHKTVDREASVAVTRWHLTPVPEREGWQGTRTAALACGVDACPRRPAGRMDHGGFG